MFLGFGEVMMRIAPEHKLRLRQVLPGRVEITCPAPATPMMMDSPHPLCAHSSAWRITLVLPIHSKE